MSFLITQPRKQSPSHKCMTNRPTCSLSPAPNDHSPQVNGCTTFGWSLSASRTINQQLPSTPINIPHFLPQYQTNPTAQQATTTTNNSHQPTNKLARKMAATKCFVFLALIVIVIADGYGGHGYGGHGHGGHGYGHDEGYGHDGGHGYGGHDGGHGYGGHDGGHGYGHDGGYGGHDGHEASYGGHHDGGYKFGPFSYGYHDYHGNHVNVDVKGPHKESYDYGFKAGGGGYKGKY